VVCWDQVFDRRISHFSEGKIAVQSLEQQILELRTGMESRIERQDRRIRVQNILLCLFAVVSLGLAAWTPAGAQAGDTVASLAARLAVVENKTADMLIVQTPMTDEPNPINVRTVRFNNVNVQIVSGTNATGAVNGRGNLIIGYNELRPEEPDDRRGSHNLVVGTRHNYMAQAFGGIVVGNFNTISGKWSSVTGGNFNTAGGTLSTVSGGQMNKIASDAPESTWAAGSGDPLKVTSGSRFRSP
jgi:hypothetical protein